jgi:hypothetical protein
MKLRIQGNSIRLRLGRAEVSRVVNDGIIEESTTFDVSGRQCLEYALCEAPETPAVTATFDKGRIVVRVPSDVLRAWAVTDQIGIETIQARAGGHTLRILIEKDFACIDAPAHESQEDAFPNPEVAAACVAQE